MKNTRTFVWASVLLFGAALCCVVWKNRPRIGGRRVDLTRLEREETPLRKGMTLVRLTCRHKPCRMYMVKIDLAESRLGFRVWQGVDGLCQRARLDEMAKQVESVTGEKPLVGLNGDFFNMKHEPSTRGNPLGVCVSGGRLITSGWDESVNAYDCLCEFGDGRPVIERLSLTGSLKSGNGTVEIDAYNAYRTSPAVRRPPSIALYDGNWPSEIPEDGVLIRFEDAGKRRARVVGVIRKGERLRPGTGVGAVVGWGKGRHAVAGLSGELVLALDVVDSRGRRPRNAVRIWNRPLVHGVFQDTKRGARSNYPRSMVGLADGMAVLFVADGRKPFYSEGCTAEDAVLVLKQEGCTEVCQMDGGGSATLWAAGGYVNRPSDLRPRRVSNGIFFCLPE